MTRKHNRNLGDLLCGGRAAYMQILCSGAPLLINGFDLEIN